MKNLSEMSMDELKETLTITKKDLKEDMVRDKITKLPKWAQQLIESKNQDIEVLKRKNENLLSTSRILENREYFTLNLVRSDVDPDGWFHIYWVFKDSVEALCSVKNGDKLIIGRKLPSETEEIKKLSLDELTKMMKETKKRRNL